MFCSDIAHGGHMYNIWFLDQSLENTVWNILWYKGSCDNFHQCNYDYKMLHTIYLCKLCLSSWYHLQRTASGSPLMKKYLATLQSSYSTQNCSSDKAIEGPQGVKQGGNGLDPCTLKTWVMLGQPIKWCDTLRSANQMGWYGWITWSQ